MGVPGLLRLVVEQCRGCVTTTSLQSLACTDHPALLVLDGNSVAHALASPARLHPPHPHSYNSLFRLVTRLLHTLLRRGFRLLVCFDGVRPPAKVFTRCPSIPRPCCVCERARVF